MGKPQWFSSRDYEHCQTFLELKIEALSHLLPTLAQQKKIPILLHITLTPTITFFKATWKNKWLIWRKASL